MPFFSVIIPTYNRAEKLKKTVISVLHQSFDDFELLIMDDGSTDNTSEVILNFDDPRIHYEWAENSGGPATPRNQGIDAATGKWICFLDADDVWYPDKLSVVHKAIMHHHDVDVFCHNEIMRVLATGKTKILKYGPFENDFYKKLLLQGNRVSTSTVTANKSFLNRYRLRFNESEEFVAIEDYDLWLRIALHGGRFFFIKKLLGEYIIENDNISSVKHKVRHNRYVLLRQHVFHIQNFEPNKHRLWRNISLRYAVADAKDFIAEGQYPKAVRIIINGVFSSPVMAVTYPIQKISERLQNKIGR